MYNIKTISSYFINSKNNLLFLNFEKNTKVFKFTIFSELLYLLIQQSRDYNNLYKKLNRQLIIINKKLLLILRNNILKELKKENIDALETKFKINKLNINLFIKLFLESKNKKEFNNILEKFLIRNKHFKSDKNLLKLVNVIRLKLFDDKIYIKYIYLNEMNNKLKYFVMDKIKKITNHIIPILYVFIKKETHRLKINNLIFNLLNKYIFKNINIEISRDKLQSSLFKFFKISTRYNIRKIPNAEELHLKENKYKKRRTDILMANKQILNFILKEKYNIGYLKFIRFFKKSKYNSIPVASIIKIIEEMKKKTLSGFFNYIGYSEVLFNNYKNNLYDINNKSININYFYKLNNIYYSDNNAHSFLYKNYINVYYMYNFLFSNSKNKKNYFFMNYNDKKIQYINKSIVKYSYYDNYVIDTDLNLNYLPIDDYKTIKYIIHLLYKYKESLKFFNKSNNYTKLIDSFFNNYKENMKKIEFKKSNIDIYTYNLKADVITYFFKKMYDNYDSKSKNISILFNSSLEYLSRFKKQKINIKFLKKQSDLLKKEFINWLSINNNLLLLIDNNYYKYNNIKLNNIELHDINEIENYSISTDINKYNIYYKFNKIYKKYFNETRSIIKSINEKPLISIVNSINNKKNYSHSLEILNNVVNKSYNNKKNNKNEIENKLFINKITNIAINNNIDSSFELSKLNDSTVTKNKNLFSLVFNELISSKAYNSVEIIKEYYNLNINSNIDKYKNIFGNNINIFPNNKYFFKENNINDQLGMLTNKKFNFYNKLLLISKKNNFFITKNNYIFIIASKKEVLFNNSKVELLNFLKFNFFFNNEDANKIISKTITSTTTQFKKLTAYQMKKRKSKKIY